MEKRELTCINCPMGCRITVTMEGDDIIAVEGNTCKRGFVYACNEVKSPVRTVTTSQAGLLTVYPARQKNRFRRIRFSRLWTQ